MNIARGVGKINIRKKNIIKIKKIRQLINLFI